MGLLTDPGAGQGKFAQHMVNHYQKLYVLALIGGVSWFMLLAHSPLNQRTYLSENALQPGLVKSDFHEESDALKFHSEFKAEMDKYETSMPYPWLIAKMRQVGMDVYTHNFTLNYPLGPKQIFNGKNVYGILRAARAASTEALVLSAPFRSTVSEHEDTSTSIALLLAFAKFASNKNYWAKDIIFLITEHEQLGMQAWLEAYHSVTCGKTGYLEHGDLRGRAGAIQAAINLELHKPNIGQIDIKIEGLNGQLPNLDLFNLIGRLAGKEGVLHTFKKTSTNESKKVIDAWFQSLCTMVSMVLTQSTGVPNGNHGLFHRFGIAAITLEGSSGRAGSHAGLQGVGRMLEGSFRSLNNLLERFHQSFFFYILPSTDQFISIGLYMPVIAALAGCLFVKACGLWYGIQDNYLSLLTESEDDLNDEELLKERKNSDKIDTVHVGLVLLSTHFIGVMVMRSPALLVDIGIDWGLPSNIGLYYGLLVASVALLAIPALFCRKITRKTASAMSVANHLHFGTALVAIGMTNFSLALVLACIYVVLLFPVVETQSRVLKWLQRILWLLGHPFVLLNASVFLNALYLHPNESLGELFERTQRAAQLALRFSVEDNYIYGNWLYPVASCVFLPGWLNVWCVLWARIRPEQTKEKAD